MASCSLFQPPILAGVTSQSLVRPKDVSSSHSPLPSSAMVSSASHLKVEAASMCSSASLKTQGHGPEYLVSQFWSTNSRQGLMARANTSEVVCRPGSALVVVRPHVLTDSDICFLLYCSLKAFMVGFECYMRFTGRHLWKDVCVDEFSNISDGDHGFKNFACAATAIS